MMDSPAGSDRDFPVSGRNFPPVAHLAVFHNRNAGVQRTGRAYVPGDGVQNGADGRYLLFMLRRHLQYPMFLILHDRHSPGHIRQHRTKGFRVAGNRFCTQIHGKGIRCGVADDPGEYRRRRHKLQIGVRRVIPGVLYKAGAGAEEFLGHGGMAREGRRAAHNQDAAVQPGLRQTGFQLFQFLVYRPYLCFPLVQVFFMAVAVIAIL